MPQWQWNTDWQHTIFGRPEFPNVYVEYSRWMYFSAVHSWWLERVCILGWASIPDLILAGHQPPTPNWQFGPRLVCLPVSLHHNHQHRWKKSLSSWRRVGNELLCQLHWQAVLVAQSFLYSCLFSHFSFVCAWFFNSPRKKMSLVENHSMDYRQ